MMGGKKKPMMDMGKGYKAGGMVPKKKAPAAMKPKGYANGGMVKVKGKNC